MNRVEKVSYVKFPIVYPSIYPDPPIEQDYETLGVSANVNNRELIMVFREKSFTYHPAVQISVVSQREYIKLVEAYDRIVLYRMSQDGVPQPYNSAFYPPQPHTKAIKDFIDENYFWTPSVSDHYHKFLFIFWIAFGVLHTLLQGDRSLLKNPDL